MSSRESIGQNRRRTDMSERKAKRARRAAKKVMNDMGLSPDGVKLMAQRSILACLRPRPKLCPRFIWRWVIARVVDELRLPPRWEKEV
jgi:hypothetical protein